MNANGVNGLGPCVQVPVFGSFRLWMYIPKSPFPSFQAFLILYFTQGRFDVSSPISTMAHDLYFILSSIHCSTPPDFRFSCSYSLADTGSSPSMTPIFRIC